MAQAPALPQLASIATLSALIQNSDELVKAQRRAWQYAMKAILGPKYHPEERTAIQVVEGVKLPYDFRVHLPEATAQLSRLLGRTIDPNEISQAMGEFVERTIEGEFDNSYLRGILPRDGIPTLLAAIQSYGIRSAFLMRFNPTLEVSILLNLRWVEAFPLIAESNVLRRTPLRPNLSTLVSSDTVVCANLLQFAEYHTGRVMLLDGDEQFAANATFGLRLLGYEAYGMLHPGSTEPAASIRKRIPESLREHENQYWLQPALPIASLLEFMNLHR